MQKRRLNRLSTLILAFVLIPLLSACPGNEADDEVGATDESESESDSSDTGGGDSSEDSSSSDTSSSDTSGSDSGTDTTDTSGGDHSLDEAICMQTCAVFDECGAGFPSCMAECLGELEYLDGECLVAEQTLMSCLGDLSCDEFAQYQEGIPAPYPCQDEEASLCGSSCEISSSADARGGCVFEYACSDEPAYEVACSAGACTCFEDGVEVGGCSNVEEVCAAIDDYTSIDTCCGWEL